MAITGVGNSTHYCAFWLGKELGIDFVNVTYSSGSQVAMSIVKGEVDVGCLPAVDLEPQINSGAVPPRIRPLRFPTCPRCRSSD